MKKSYRYHMEQVASVSNRIGSLLYTTSQGGNISCRLPDGMIAITPSKRNKRLLKPDEICIVDMSGKAVRIKSGFSISSEFTVHSRIYETREDVNAIIHAHPPFATGIAIAHSDVLEKPVLPESCMELGPVLSVPYVEPGSEELAVRISELIKRTNTVLMQNHGALVVSGEGIYRAMELLELLEVTAASLITARIFGEINIIPQAEMARLSYLYRLRGVKAPGKDGYYEEASEAFLNHDART